MLYRSTSNWKNPENNAGLLFFAQRLEELTFEYTLDSYKAPTTNAPFLVSECIEQIDNCEQSGISSSSISHILEELKSKLFQNPVVSSIVSLSVESYTKLDNDDLPELRRRLAVLQREIAPQIYALRTMEMIAEDVGNNEKFHLNFLSRELATTLIGLGVSPFHINRTVRKVFFTAEASVDEETIIDTFFREVFPHHHNFTVAFKTNMPERVLHEDVLKRLRLKIKSSTDGIFTTEAIPEEFLGLEEAQSYVVAENVRATDSYSAVELALSKVGSLHDLFRLFNHKAGFEIDERGLAEQKCCAGELRFAPSRINRMQFINDNRPKQAGQKLNKFMQGLLLPLGSDKNKFLRVIDFHGMCLNSEIVENQILNLWTCFETIVPMNRQRTTIANVAGKIAPFVGLLYVRRLFECLTYDLLRWNRRKLSNILKNIEFPDDYELVDKVFYLTTQSTCEPQLEKLFKELGPFELLRFRMFQLRQSFASPKKSIETIKQHQQRVEWQIHRIYRTRNAIIHSGKTPKFTSLLVANAHDYFDQVFELCCELSSGDGGFRNFTECFDFVGIRFQQYLKCVNSLNDWSDSNVQLVLWRPREVPTRKWLFPNARDD
ncbi:hypothetical protein EOI86_03475 [Hwanghaeella grinnelliae]|uniref:Apea-like HEPN domain-containing protein n=1 Tax=Hwanghaeella grinnelliae TaxID=2500179 RepID=A0A3S2Z995_9PROT|nr:hypothetical protein [Hwanghaeella grinnelliae]RVU38363.1 hypothetical protein EOI86_03475 [Hwanghaeella grinnelliae]